MDRMSRDERGRYAKGNCGGPGRPKAQTEEQYLTTLSETVTIDDWLAITEKAVDQAKQGDHRARQWLANKGGLQSSK